MNQVFEVAKITPGAVLRGKKEEDVAIDPSRTFMRSRGANDTAGFMREKKIHDLFPINFLPRIHEVGTVMTISLTEETRIAPT